MFVVGLTGSLSSGKTLVASYFKQLGAKIIDSDKIVHKLMKPNGACFDKIVKTFSDEIVSRGNINRSKLAGIVFKDKKKLKKLESIIHPAVKKEIIDNINFHKSKKKSNIVVVEVPLLFESKFNRLMDFNIVVKSSRIQQVNRSIKKTGMSRTQVCARIKSQLPLKEKIKLADYIIDNRGTKLNTQKQVKEVWRLLLQKGKIIGGKYDG